MLCVPCSVFCVTCFMILSLSSFSVFLLTIYYFLVFNFINWIKLIQKNSNLLHLLVIISYFFFFSFPSSSVPASDNFKKKNLSKPEFFGTLCSLQLFECILFCSIAESLVFLLSNPECLTLHNVDQAVLRSGGG